MEHDDDGHDGPINEPLVPEVVNRADEIRELISEAVDAIGRNYFHLGEYLWEVNEEKHYEEWGGQRYSSLEEYVEMELGFKRSKAYAHIRLWKLLGQQLGMTWEQLKDAKFSKVNVVLELVERDPTTADYWIEQAKTHSRRELAEMAREAKRQAGLLPKPRRDVEDVSTEKIETASQSAGPFVEHIPEADPEFTATIHAPEADPETGRLAYSRLTFLVTREQGAHISAAFERMADITGIQKQGELLDLVAAEINNTFADQSAGGIAHRLDFYVENLERIFDVQISVKVPDGSKLRSMSRMEEGSDAG